MTGHNAVARRGARRARPAALLTVLAAALAACGPATAQEIPGGGSPSPGSTGAAAGAGPDGVPTAAATATARTGVGGAHATASATPRGGTGPGATHSSAPPAAAVPPPAGHYVYQASGCTSCGSVGYQAAPSTVTADVSDQAAGNAVRVTTATVVDSSNSTTSTVDVSPTEAREVHMTMRGSVGPVAYTSDLTPQPAFLVAPLPLSAGQSWQISWQDASSHTSATGSGRTVREETVPTAMGDVDAFLVEITLQIQSDQYTATTDNWVWIDPRTHVTVKWRDQRTIHSAAGTGQYDVSAVLASGPAA